MRVWGLGLGKEGGETLKVGVEGVGGTLRGLSLEFYVTNIPQLAQ